MNQQIVLKHPKEDNHYIIFQKNLSAFLKEKGFPKGMLDPKWLNLPNDEKILLRDEWRKENVTPYIAPEKI